MNDFAASIRSTVDAESAGPLLAHVDVFLSRAAIMPILDATKILDRQVETLTEIAAGRMLLFPAFNYDFLKTRTYDPAESPSQLGPLGEFARREWAEWRVGPPVFNVIGRGPRPLGIEEEGDVDPFGSHSVFAWLHRNEGNVLLYGTTLASLTAIHYVERLSGGPLYRYDKIFAGTVLRDGEERAVRLVYHCRPMGMRLDYDFPRLAAEAEEAGALFRLSSRGSEVGFVRFGALCDYLLERLAADPLHFLDASSREWVEPLLERTGRRFVAGDFE